MKKAEIYHSENKTNFLVIRKLLKKVWILIDDEMNKAYFARFDKVYRKWYVTHIKTYPKYEECKIYLTKGGVK